MPLASDELWTAEMVRAMPEDGNRYELVWGELLVSPSPRRAHQRVVFRLARLIAAYCEEHQLGETLPSPADISWSDDTLVQPDIFVIAREEAGGDDWRTVKTLRLVVEVLSPSTAKHDRFQKRKLYQSQGVGTIWLVDADKGFVEVWTPDATFPTRENERVTWHPADATTPLVIDVAALFA